MNGTCLNNTKKYSFLLGNKNTWNISKGVAETRSVQKFKKKTELVKVQRQGHISVVLAVFTTTKYISKGRQCMGPTVGALWTMWV